MKPFLGLFAHWDVITRQSPPAFLAGFFKEKMDSEHYISKRLCDSVSSSLLSPRREMGGNAGNAAAALSELGIGSVLSCPRRSMAFMSEISKHKIFLIDRGKEKAPDRCSRNEDVPEHIIFEIDGYRKIFSHDQTQLQFMLDRDFWGSLGKASYLFLSGFHAIPARHKKKMDEIVDNLERRKFKVHMELGFGAGLMRYAIKRLLDRNCLDSIGMNETELETIGISASNPLEIRENLLSYLERSGLERIGLHSRTYRVSVFRSNVDRNLEAARLSVLACAAKALGGIKEYMEKAKSVPYSGIKACKGKDFFIIPTKVAENPKKIVSIGDAAAVIDSFFAMKR